MSGVIDLLLILAVGFFALYLLFPYVNAEYLNTEYPDWYVHAFRVVQLRDHGFSSWSHTWSNGISLWTAYQFTIHYLTLWVSQLASVSIPRAMVLVILLLTIMYGVFHYVSLRLLPVSKLAALTATLLSFTISQYYVAIRDYSIILGFTLYPIIVILWKKYLEGKFSFAFPYICGLLFYVHPILAIFSLGLYIMSFFSHNRKLLSFQTPIQLVFFVGASVMFWYPVIFHPGYSNPIFSGTEFLNIVLLPRELFGINWIVYGLYVVCVLCFLVPGFSRPRWWSMLTFYTAIWLLIVHAGLAGAMPGFITQFQFTRGMVFIGINIVFLSAYILDRMLKSSSLTVSAFVVALATVSVVRAMWFSTLYAPSPLSVISDQVAYFTPHFPELKGSRIWPYDIGASSFSSGSDVMFPVSYSGHRDSNPLAQRMMQLGLYDPHLKTGTPKNLERFDAYLRVSSTPYALFDTYMPVGNGLTESYDYRILATKTIEHVDFNLLVAPWKSSAATFIHPDLVRQFGPFPPIANINSIEGQTHLDEETIKLSNALSDKRNKTTIIQYPSEEKMYVAIANNSDYAHLFIVESFDENWKATLNNTPVSIQPAGPNYMRIDLDKNAPNGTLV